MGKASTVADYIESSQKRKEELLLLREIFQKTKMDESIKWGIPSYGYKKKNLAGMAAFKSYVGIWFHQGVFLKDEQKKLENAQEKTVAMRQWRFNSVAEIQENYDLILHYLEESILNQEMGKEVKPNKKKPLVIPDELKNRMQSDASLKSNFSALSVSKQREYADYISEAKRQETKESRLDKITPMIEKGVGLHDKYKNC